MARVTADGVLSWSRMKRLLLYAVARTVTPISLHILSKILESFTMTLRFIVLLAVTDKISVNIYLKSALDS